MKSEPTRLLFVFPCGGELREIVADGAASAPERAARGGPGEGPRRPAKGWVLLCNASQVDIHLCPRLQEMRKFLDAERQGVKHEDVPAWLADLKTYLADRDADRTAVDYLDAQAVVPVAGDETLCADAQTRPVPGDPAHRVEDAERRANERDGQRDAVLNGDVYSQRTPLPLQIMKQDSGKGAA
jgi:hypothetical protein